MRIEGTYTFAAPIDQVFSALTHPDILSQVIPGCERLVQLGPTSTSQPPVYEVRLRRGPGAEVYTLTLTLSSLESPSHLRAELEGRGPDGPFSGHGLVDLVEQDSHTVAAAVWEVKSPVLAGMASERKTAWNGSAEQFAGVVRDRATSAIRAMATAPTTVRHLTTPRGRVVILPKRVGMLPPEQKAQLKRATWIGGALLAGLAAIGLVFALVRRLVGSDDADDADDSNEM